MLNHTGGIGGAYGNAAVEPSVSNRNRVDLVQAQAHIGDEAGAAYREYAENAEANQQHALSVNKRLQDQQQPIDEASDKETVAKLKKWATKIDDAKARLKFLQETRNEYTERENEKLKHELNALRQSMSSAYPGASYTASYPFTECRTDDPVDPPAYGRPVAQPVDCRFKTYDATAAMKAESATLALARGIQSMMLATAIGVGIATSVSLTAGLAASMAATPSYF